MRTSEKAHSINVIKCDCGRVAITLEDNKGQMFASAELNPNQWLEVCNKIIDLNSEVMRDLEAKIIPFRKH